MGFNFYSWLHTVFWSSLVFWLIHTIWGKRRLTECKEAVCLLIVYMLCIFRLLFPIDLKFSKGINLRGFFATTSAFILKKRIILPLCSFSLWDIFLVIWGVGAVWKVIQFFLRYSRNMQRLDAMELYARNK